MKEDLDRIDRENSASEAVRVKLEKVYKFSDSTVYNYMIVNTENGKILINDKTDSFVLSEKSGAIYFYDSCRDSLYFTDGTSDYVCVAWDNFIDEHLFVLNPKQYWNRNSAKKFTISNISKDKMSQITFVMKSFNVDVLIDKMFIKSVGTYLIEDSSFFIHSFIKEIDPELIAGDGVSKEIYQLYHDFDNNDISRITAFTDSVIGTKAKCNFPEYYDLETNVFNSCRKSWNNESSEDLSDNYGRLKSIDGDSLILSDLESDYILIDFWFMRCPGCIQGIPHMNKLRKQYPREKLIVVGVNPVDKEVNALRDFSQKKNITYPIYISEKSFAEHYNVKSYPRYVLIDNRNGKLSVIGNFTIMDELYDALKELE